MPDQNKPIVIEGWGRLLEENPNGLFSFTHTIFIYASHMAAAGKDTEPDCVCHGIFPVRIEIKDGRITFLNPLPEGDPAPEPASG